MLKIRPIRPEYLTLLGSAFLLLAYNLPLWRHLLEVTPPGWRGVGLVLAFAALLFACFNLILSLLAVRGVLKPALSVLLLVSAGVAYFMNHYGVLIDVEMLRNVVETDPAEVRDLLSFKLGAYLLLLGVLPAWLLWRVPIAWRSWPRELLGKGCMALASVALIAAVALCNYQGLSSLLRNHHELRMQVVPSNYVGAAFGLLKGRVQAGPQQLQPVATDAVRASSGQDHPRKSLTVLVVGESARAENFSLNGYGRDTNPRLQAEPGLITFSDVHSCGTETAVSVPCMFSDLTRAHYSDGKAKHQEGLLDVLKRAGFAVLWRDNQSGCKGTCDRVDFEELTHSRDPAFCASGECHDEVLLKDLQTFIDGIDRDTVLVLHQMGSHGPAYFKRYPPAFEKFTPVCRSSDLSACSRESIVNGYDNTLLYTDYVLSSLIDLLRKNESRLDTAMIYLSDHGESLGEYNLFLHGTPYLLAPDQQKHVGMFAWFSEGYRESFALDGTCLRQRSGEPLSQDYLFHSMLGLLEVRTRTYDPGLDLFAACRESSVRQALAFQ
ncbi:phosphoethanolamine transferase [Pseudomonas schmalbachii]|uniref:Phosphoethanolamine--lipid A transferase n=1 Tax=Pseudomonas schmalbachii TaxID=2816993 RepID=A0ABS3TP78_9PSED|nr:phosphoethanolamine--lipid A transferase [Pseudomonas schmalbachii]MBO3275470.1 phosphoethanolamine--lipid A transferase [Pseudomonas schmalbachii]